MRCLSPLVLALIALSCGAQDDSATPAAPTPLMGESGLAMDPAVSSDGNWLAYSSDRDGSGFLHIWIQPLAGGEPRQLTKGANDHREPAFSPDGRTLAYRSEGDGGGIYVVPLDGGEPRLLAPGGRRPRFSPDGAGVAYWASESDGRTQVFIVPASGGSPRAVQPEFHSARGAVWSPDGKRLIYAGCKDSSAGSCDWWVSPVSDGEAAAVGTAKLFQSHHLTAGAAPELWLSGNTIVFQASTGDQTRLWTLNLLPDAWRASGAPQRLTSGDRDERSPAAAPDGRVVFASRTQNIDVWSLPVDANRAAPTGTLTRLTTDPAIDQRPSLSLDGERVAWETSRGGNFEVWVKDLSSGQEKGLTSGPLREHMPALSRDGSKLVYDTHDGETVTIFAADFKGGEPVKIWSENVGQGSFQWTAKGDAVLYFHREPPGTVGLMHLASGKRTALLRHPKLNLSLADARLSPDGRWIAFPAPLGPRRSPLAVARISGKVIEDERDWSYVTPDNVHASQPEWSPDGRWLYFLSDLTGRLAVWAVPLSPQMRPQGAPKLIFDFASARLSIADMRPRDIGLSVASDKLALAAAESTGVLLSVAR